MRVPFAMEIDEFGLDKTSWAEILGIACREYGMVVRLLAYTGEISILRKQRVIYCNHGWSGESPDADDADDDEPVVIPKVFAGPKTSGVAVDMDRRFWVRTEANRQFLMGMCEICRTVWIKEEEVGINARQMA